MSAGFVAAALAALLTAAPGLSCGDGGAEPRATAGAPAPQATSDGLSVERLSLQVLPHRAEAGSRVKLRVESRLRPRHLRRAAQALFQERVGSRWKTIYVLNSRTPGGPPTVEPPGTPGLFVGLIPHYPDIVKLPKVPTGRYRIEKAVEVDRGAFGEGNTRTLHAHVWVVVRPSA